MSVLSGARSRLRRRVPRLGRMHETFQEKDVPFMAGSVAFTAFLSLLPLLVLLFLVVAVVGEGELADQVVAATESLLPAEGRELLGESIRNRSEFSIESVISAVVVLWGALKLFMSLDTAFAEIYAAASDQTFLDKLTDSLVALTTLALAMVAAVAAGVAFAFFDWIPYVELLSPAVLFLGLIVAFLPIYYVIPDVETTVRSALPGTVVAALGCTLLEALFQVYVFLSSSASGALGAVVVFLTWLYFGSLILLVGAVVNAVLSRQADTGTAERTELTVTEGTATE